MTRWWLVIVLAACGEAPRPEPAAPPQPAAPAHEDDVEMRVEELRREMCACPAADPACAHKVRHAIRDFDDTHRDARVPFGQVKHLAHLASETDRCEQHALHEDMLGAMERFKDAMCACAVGDNDCAMRVQKDMQDYAEAHRHEFDGKISDDDVKKATDLGMAMAKCSAAAMGMGSGTP